MEQVGHFKGLAVLKVTWRKLRGSGKKKAGNELESSWRHSFKMGDHLASLCTRNDSRAY